MPFYMTTVLIHNYCEHLLQCAAVASDIISLWDFLVNTYDFCTRCGYIHAHNFVCMYACMYMYIYVYGRMCVYEYVCLYVCMYVCS